MATEEKNSSMKWLQWVLGILILIAMAVSGYAVNKADNAVPKDDYRIDQARVEAGLKCLNEKMDRILERLR